MMYEQVKQFIEENINLIEQNRWEEVYKKYPPPDFTEILLKCDVNPLEQGLSYIPDNFLYGASIDKFVIPNNIINIGDFAFYKCTSLTNVIIGNSVTSIGERAFENCKSLTSIEIPNSVTSISYEAFYNCTSLTSVTIGNSVTSIDDYAFHSCLALTKINYTGTIDEWNVISKGTYWKSEVPATKIICTDGEIEL